jgi:uncharacterized protein (TIGR00661 family)
MAKVLYGVAGQGFGHSTRSELIGKRLVEAGHEVVFVASQQSYEYLKPTFPNHVRKVYGLSFYYKGGRVRVFRTAWQNISGYRKGFKVNRRLLLGFAREFQPDIVLSDFEPFSAWWAWRNKVPCVSIDNEHLLTCCKLDRDLRHWRERLIAKAVTRGYHTNADAYVILTFFKTRLKNKYSVLTPPVVREIVLQFEPSCNEHILIYSTDASQQQHDNILEAAQKSKKFSFIVYGFDKDEEKGNCTFKKASTENFLQDLASCRGVIATAGFSLISECLYFKKPMLLMPIRDQYEQITNAHYIEKIGLGRGTKDIDPETIQSFVEDIDTFTTNSDIIQWPDNERFFEILDMTLNKIKCPLNLIH